MLHLPVPAACSVCEYPIPQMIFCMRRYEQEGTRRSVDAVMLVAERNIPHVLLIQVCKLT